MYEKGQSDQNVCVPVLLQINDKLIYIIRPPNWFFVWRKCLDLAAYIHSNNRDLHYLSFQCYTVDDLL